MADCACPRFNCRLRPRLTSRQTTIRVKFSDRTMLEKTFSSADRIKAVYVFVRDSLADEVKPIKFVLCECTVSTCVNAN